ncbi:ABC transporter ATP-binding protein [Miniimonas arenae]|uniref:ABC transporter ATP-binding protein n=1 Tax=Miniimonas arenae TaxID=676201 RepID=A0A5C5BFH3_9MICO|nr:ABC transporter ATP-binding protein [Miniimonas arenae]TNU77364.1 ABC transporter ATP-binding protein [Miniimonas arenae]
MSRVVLAGAGKCYGEGESQVWAVRDASHVFETGSFTVIQGVSGSGKSTLLNLMSGLDVPSRGQVHVDGLDLGHMSDPARADFRLRRVGCVFQEHLLIEEFSALENVMLPLEAVGSAASTARTAAGSALGDVGLARLEDRLPAHLSGGQRQRVGIARALVGDRTLLLADEPSGALDSVTSREVYLLLRAAADRGVTVVVATHDPALQAFADVVLDIIDGQLHAREVSL